MLAEATRGSIDEVYQGAVASSNLRVGNDHTLATPGDVTAASGMNRHRMGLALLRLRTEWGKAARPSAPTPDDIARLSRTYAIETEYPHAGKVKIPREGKEPEYLLPLKLARRERNGWFAHELKLALMTMRTLPGVRTSMLAHSDKQAWGCDAHSVAQVILWWLDPKCTVCGGNKEEVVLGTGRTNGKVCPHCMGTGKENRGDPPCGRRGALLAGYINGCLQAARRELREGIYRERRTVDGEAARGEPLSRLRAKGK